MRKTALNGALELARRDPRVCLIASDLGFGSLDDFRAEMPDRLFREGISEQAILGQAAGLALGGKIVYVNAIAAFLVRRALEQLILDLGLNQARVRLIGSGGGLVYAPLGPTHLAVEDLALLRPVPGLTILTPGDAGEMAQLLPQTLELDGPVYIRLAKGGDPDFSSGGEPRRLGRAVRLLGVSGALDILFVTCGITAQMALGAAAELRAEGRAVEALHCHTFKPLDEEAVLEAAGRARLVVTVEEHVRYGGLGSAVAELLAESGAPSRPRLIRAALPDAFFHEHGSQNQILRHHGLSAENLARLVREAPEVGA